jgi:hypothetical protein
VKTANNARWLSFFYAPGMVYGVIAPFPQVWCSADFGKDLQNDAIFVMVVIWDLL